jgi:hypothetical protein
MKNTLAFVPDSEGSSVGWLCVKYSDVFSDKPERTVLYWPVEHGSLSAIRDVFPEVDTDKELRDGGNGRYSIYRGWNWSPPVVLKDGGQTKPIKSEIIPIPCPKVRAGIDTRFRNGSWEKYLKSKGWVTA